MSKFTYGFVIFCIIIVVYFFVGTIDINFPNDSHVVYKPKKLNKNENAYEFYGELNKFFTKKDMEFYNCKMYPSYKKDGNIDFLYNRSFMFFQNSKLRDEYLFQNSKIIGKVLSSLDNYKDFESPLNWVYDYNPGIIKINLLILLLVEKKLSSSEDTMNLLSLCFKNLSFSEDYLVPWWNDFSLMTNYLSKNLHKFSKKEVLFISKKIEEIDIEFILKRYLRRGYTIQKKFFDKRNHTIREDIKTYDKNPFFQRYIFHKNRYFKTLISNIDSIFREKITSIPVIENHILQTPFQFKWSMLLTPMCVNKFYTKKTYYKISQGFFQKLLIKLSYKKQSILKHSLLHKKESSK